MLTAPQSPPGEQFAGRTAPSLPAKLTPPKWEKHEKGKGATKEKWWTASWEGLKLRIEWKKLAGVVVFDGYINQGHVSQNAKLSLTQAEVISKASQQLQKR